MLNVMTFFVNRFINFIYFLHIINVNIPIPMATSKTIATKIETVFYTILLYYLIPDSLVLKIIYTCKCRNNLQILTFFFVEVKFTKVWRL